MDDVRIIEIKKNIFSKNIEDANILRNALKKKGVTLINVMSSPGSGKTTTLIALINELKKDYNIRVMEADIDSAVDASLVKEKTGVETIQLHTGGMCHLDAKMTEYGLDHLDLEDVDLVFLENVGNLVCPAEFDTGAHFNINILSVPEGDDKPLKYPLMYEVCDLVIINKIDVAPYFNFDTNKCKQYIKMRNEKASVLEISALKNEGINEVANWIKQKMEG
ncbi:MAG: hydrogenase nickel incorporation protein HypB [Bacilli bacterium]|nr:hydrogenase nickel incorporation protein HypB [Bacilli bacterium]